MQEKFFTEGQLQDTAHLLPGWLLLPVAWCGWSSWEFPSDVQKNRMMKTVVKETVTQSCLTLWDPMDCSAPGSSIHGILQARILNGLPCPSPGELPNPGIKPRFPSLQAGSLPSEPPDYGGTGHFSEMQMCHPLCLSSPSSPN